MSAPTSKIVYTLTDEAPALATASLLPIIRRFAGEANPNRSGAPEGEPQPPASQNRPRTPF